MLLRAAAVARAAATRAPPYHHHLAATTLVTATATATAAAAAVASALRTSLAATAMASWPGAAAAAGVRGMASSPTKKARRAAPPTALPPGATPPRRITVALVGRPNVGKSRLFNRLVGRRLAIVSDVPGTTRDWKEAEGRLGDLTFVVMDTGGLEDGAGGHTGADAAKMREHTARAIAHADVVCYLVDARAGVSDADAAFVRWLKRLRPSGAIHLIANKAEAWADGVVAGEGAGGDEVAEAEGDGSGADAWAYVDTAATRSSSRAARAALRAGGPSPATVLAQCYRLGLGTPLALSAETGAGLSDLHNLLHAAATTPLPGDAPAAAVADVDAAPVADADVAAAADTAAAADAAAATTDRDAAIALAVVGRPNVGKSTLVNALLGEERVLTGPTPGLTRDTTTVELTAGGRRYRLVDTAGMRRWGAWDLTTPLEGEAVGAAKRALQSAAVVMLVVDASGGAAAGLQAAAGDSTAAARAQRRTEADGSVGGVPGMTRQDMAIAEQVLSEGRGLVVVANKIDALPADAADAAVRRIEEQLAATHDGRGTPVVAVSAATGQGRDGILPTVARVHTRWSMQVPTARLNTWLGLMSRHHPPPSTTTTVGGRPGPDGRYATRRVPLRVKFIAQTNTRPPTFTMFVNRDDVPVSYSRFLENALRKEFDLGGAPIRWHIKTSTNPFRRPPGSSGGGGGGGVRKPAVLARHKAARARARTAAAAAAARAPPAAAPGTPERVKPPPTNPSRPVTPSLRGIARVTAATGGRVKRVSRKLVRTAGGSTGGAGGGSSRGSSGSGGSSGGGSRGGSGGSNWRPRSSEGGSSRGSGGDWRPRREGAPRSGGGSGSGSSGGGSNWRPRGDSAPRSGGGGGGGSRGSGGGSDWRPRGESASRSSGGGSDWRPRGESASRSSGGSRGGSRPSTGAPRGGSRGGPSSSGARRSFKSSS